jgi:hypothetical protein
VIVVYGRQGVDVGTMMTHGGRSSHAAIGPCLGDATEIKSDRTVFETVLIR